MDTSVFEYSLKLYNITDELRFIESNLGLTVPDASAIYNHYYDSCLTLSYDSSITWSPPRPQIATDMSLRYLYISPDPGLSVFAVVPDVSDTSVGRWRRYNSWEDGVRIVHQPVFGYGAKYLIYTYQTVLTADPDTDADESAPVLLHQRVLPIIITPPTLSSERQALNVSAALVVAEWFQTHNTDVSQTTRSLTAMAKSAIAIPDESTWFQDHCFNGLPTIGDYEIVGYDHGRIYPDANGRSGTYAPANGNTSSNTIIAWYGWAGLYLYYTNPYIGVLSIRHRRSPTTVAVYTTHMTVYPWLPSNDVWAMYLECIQTTVLSPMGTWTGNTVIGDYPDTSFVLNSTVGGVLFANSTFSFDTPPEQLLPGVDMVLSPAYSFHYVRHAVDFSLSVSDHYTVSVLHKGDYDISYNYTLYPEKIRGFRESRLATVLTDGLAFGIPVLTDLLGQLLIIDLPQRQDGVYLLDLSGAPITGSTINIRVDTDLLTYFDSEIRLNYEVADHMMLMVSGDLIGNATSQNRHIDLRTPDLFSNIRAFTVSGPTSMTLTVSWFNRERDYVIETPAYPNPHFRGAVLPQAYTMPILPDISLNRGSLFAGNANPTELFLYSQWYDQDYDVLRQQVSQRLDATDMEGAVRYLNGWLTEMVDGQSSHSHFPEKGGNAVPIIVHKNAGATRFSRAGHLLYVSQSDPADCKITRYYDSQVDINMVALFDHSANSRVNLVTSNYGHRNYSGIYFSNYRKIYDIRDLSRGSYSFPMADSIRDMRAGRPYIVNPVPEAILEGARAVGLTADRTLFWGITDQPTETLSLPDGYVGKVGINIVLDRFRAGLSPNVSGWLGLTSTDFSTYVNVSGTEIISDYPTTHVLSPEVDLALEYGRYTIYEFMDSSLIDIATAIRREYIDICAALATAYITWEKVLTEELATYTDLLDPKYHLTETILDYVGLPPSDQATRVYALRDSCSNLLTAADISLVAQACQQPTFFYQSGWATIGGTLQAPTVNINLTTQQHEVAVQKYTTFLTTVISNYTVSFTRLCNDINLTTASRSRPDYQPVYRMCQKALDLGLIDPGYLIYGPVKFPYIPAIYAGYVPLVYAFSPTDRDPDRYAIRPYFSTEALNADWSLNFIEYVTSGGTQEEVRDAISVATLLGIIGYDDLLALSQIGYYPFLASSMITASAESHTYNGLDYIIPLGLNVAAGYQQEILFTMNHLPNSFNVLYGGVALLPLPDEDTCGNLFFVPLDPVIIPDLAIAIPHDVSLGHTYTIEYACYLANTGDIRKLKSISIDLVIPEQQQYRPSTINYTNLVTDLPSVISSAVTTPRVIGAAGLDQAFATVASMTDTINTGRNSAIYSDDPALLRLLSPPQPPPIRQTAISTLNRTVIDPLYNQPSVSQGLMYGFGYNPLGELTYAVDSCLGTLVVTGGSDGYFIDTNISGQPEKKVSLNVKYVVAKDGIIQLKPVGAKVIRPDPRLMTGNNIVRVAMERGYRLESSTQTVSRLTDNGRDTTIYVVTGDPRSSLTVYQPIYVGNLINSGQGLMNLDYQPSTRDTARASFEVTGDGVQAGALANVGASHTIVVGNDVIRNAVTFSIRATASAYATVAFDYKKGVKLQAHVGAMVVAMITNTAVLNGGGVLQMTSTTYLRLKTGTEANGSVILGWEPTNIQLAAGGSGFAGSVASVNTKGAVEMGPVLLGAGAGISNGFHVAAGGSGSIRVTDGVLAVSLNGNIGLLLGVKVDLFFNVDFNVVIDSVKWIIYGPSYLLIRNGMITAAPLILRGVMEATDAIRNGVITVEVVLNRALAEVSTLVEEGFFTGYEAVERGYIDATRAALGGLITAEQAIVNFGQSGYELFSYGVVSIDYLVERRIINYIEFAQEANGLLSRGIIDIHEYILCTGQNLEDVVGITTGLVRGGVIDLATATEQVGVEVGNAIADEISNFFDNIGDFFSF